MKIHGALLALAVLAGCSGAGERVGDGRFPGLGSHSRPVATSVPLAQSLFDQGIAFLYAFNHDEAIRSFRMAAEADPSCAMAAWGVALAHGPHINNPALDEDHAKAAWESLVEARRLAAAASEVERELIEALARRYSDPPAADRLRTRTPGLGHLVHMPSHIDVRRGRWLEAMTANRKAIAAPWGMAFIPI